MKYFSFFLDQTSLLEFLHILTTNHKLVFASVNNEPEFIAGLCHWLLVMGTHKSVDVSEKTSEELESEVATSVSLEEESSCSRLLAAAAERVWDIFLQNKREVGRLTCPHFCPFLKHAAFCIIN